MHNSVHKNHAEKGHFPGRKGAGWDHAQGMIIVCLIAAALLIAPPANPADAQKTQAAAGRPTAKETARWLVQRLGQSKRGILEESVGRRAGGE